MITFPEMRRAEINYSAFYGPLSDLMQRAGASVAAEIKSMVPSGSKVLFLCGTGNNGGDGLTAAEMVRDCCSVKVIIVSLDGRVKSDLAQKALSSYHGEMEKLENLPSAITWADLVVDAILGTGTKPGLREPVKSAINVVNSSGKAVLSIDLPSGLGSEEAIKPIRTVTFTDTKEGMTPNNSGMIVIRDIGIPASCFNHSGPGDFVYYPLPLSSSHKGMNGELSVIAGWESYGAGVISSKAALSTGIDLVKVYLPPTMIDRFASHSVEFMLREYDQKYIEQISKSSAILIGPGLGTGDDRSEMIHGILERYTGPIVLDADALKIMRPEVLKGKNAVITPHRKEFEIFTGLDPTEENAISSAQRYGFTVLLKGETDIITDGRMKIHSPGGNARMTMGGTGDMLAGLVAGFVAKGMPSVRAASFASYINKASADLCYVEKGYWYSVQDMLEKVPYVINSSLKLVGGA